jgi:hypothetical protein
VGRKLRHGCHRKEPQALYAPGVERLSELHELLHDAESQRTCLEEEGEDTTLHDEVIPKLR